MVVTQSTEWLLLTPEVLGSTPADGNFYCSFIFIFNVNYLFKRLDLKSAKNKMQEFNFKKRDLCSDIWSSTLQAEIRLNPTTTTYPSLNSSAP